MKKFVLPDGSFFSVDDDVSLEEARRIARREFPELYMERGKRGNLVQQAWEAAKEYVGDVGTGIGSLYRSDKELAGDINERSIERSKGVQPSTSFEDVKKAFGEGEYLKGLGTGAQWAGETAAQSFGYLAPALGAAAAATKFIPHPATQLAGMGLAGLAGLAAAAPGYYGKDLRRQQEEARKEGADAEFSRGKAAVAGVGEAALDMGSTLLTLGGAGVRMLAGTTAKELANVSSKELAAQLAKDSMKSLVPKAIAGGGKGMLFEVPTEVAQQVLERWQAGLPLLNDEALSEYQEAGAGAVVLGGGMGAVGGLSERRAGRQYMGQQQHEAQIEDAKRTNARNEERAAQAAPYLDDPETLASVFIDGNNARKRIAEISSRMEAIKAAKDPALDSENKELDAEKKQLQKYLKERVGPLLKGKYDAVAEYIKYRGMTPEEAFNDRLGYTETKEVPPEQAVSVEEELLRRQGKQPPTIEPVTEPAKPGVAFEAFLHSFDDPQRAFDTRTGVEKINGKEAFDFLATHPEIAANVINGNEAFPGLNAAQISKLQSVLESTEMMKRKAQAGAISKAEEALGVGRVEDASISAEIDKANEIQSFVEDAGPVLLYGENADSVDAALKRNVVTPDVLRALGLPFSKTSLNLDDLETANGVLAAVENKIPVLQSKLQKESDAILTATDKEAQRLRAATVAAQLQELQLLRSKALSVRDDPRAQEDLSRRAAQGQLAVVENRLAEADKREELDRYTKNRARRTADTLGEVNEVRASDIASLLNDIYRNGSPDADASPEAFGSLRGKLVASISREIDKRRVAAGLKPLTAEERAPLITIDGRLRQLLNTAQENSAPYINHLRAVQREKRKAAEKNPKKVLVPAQMRAGKIIRAAYEEDAPVDKSLYKDIPRMSSSVFSAEVSKAINEIERLKQQMLRTGVPTERTLARGPWSLAQRGETPTVFERTQGKPLYQPLVDTEEPSAIPNTPRDRIIEDINNVQGIADMPPGAASVLEAVRRRAVDNKGSAELFSLTEELIREIQAGRDPRPAVATLSKRLFAETRSAGEGASNVQPGISLENVRGKTGATPDLFPASELPPSALTAKPTTTTAAFLRGFSPEKRGAHAQRAAKSTATETRAFRTALLKALAPIVKMAAYASSPTRAALQSDSSLQHIDPKILVELPVSVKRKIADGGTTVLVDYAQQMRSVAVRIGELNDVLREVAVNRASINQIGEAINRVMDVGPSMQVIEALSNVADVAIAADTTLNERILRDELEAKQRVPGERVKTDVGVARTPRGMTSSREGRSTSGTARPAWADLVAGSEVGAGEIVSQELREADQRLRETLSGTRTRAAAAPVSAEVKTQTFFDAEGSPVTPTNLTPKYYAPPPAPKNKRGRPSKADVAVREQEVAADREANRVISATSVPRDTTKIGGEAARVAETVRLPDERAEQDSVRAAEQESVSTENKVKPVEQYKKLAQRIAFLRARKSLTPELYTLLKDSITEFNALRATFNPDLLREIENEKAFPKTGIMDRWRQGRDNKLADDLAGVPEDFSPSSDSQDMALAQIKGWNIVSTDKGDARLRDPETMFDKGTVSNKDYEEVANADENSVHFVWAPEDSPALMAAVEGQDIDPADVLGMTLPDGTIIVVGKNHANRMELEKTVAHELGHERTNSFLGKEGYEKLTEKTSPLQLLGLAKDLDVEDEVRGAMERAGWEAKETVTMSRRDFMKSMTAIAGATKLPNVSSSLSLDEQISLFREILDNGRNVLGELVNNIPFSVKETLSTPNYFWDTLSKREATGDSFAAFVLRFDNELEIDAITTEEQYDSEVENALKKFGGEKALKLLRQYYTEATSKLLADVAKMKDATGKSEKTSASLFEQKRAGLSEIFAKLNEGIPFESMTERVKRFVREWMGAVQKWLRDIGLRELGALNVNDLYYTLAQAKKSNVPVTPLEGTGVDFLFAGLHAKKRNRAAFTLAKEMEKRGAIPERIRAATGWFRGKYDKKWRYEIADENAKIKSLKDIEAGVPHKLSEVLDHPSLFEAYPQLEDTPVVLDKDAYLGTGSHNPKTKTITLGVKEEPWSDKKKTKAENIETLRGVLLHEIQHWIQDKEYFASGGNSLGVLRQASEVQRRKVAQKNIDAIEIENAKLEEDIARYNRVPEKLRNKFTDALKEVRDFHYEEGWLKLYRKSQALAAEVAKFWFGYSTNAAITVEDRVAVSVYFEYDHITRDSRTLEENKETLHRLNEGLKGAEHELRMGLIRSGGADTLYHNLAGEIESREVEDRRTFSESQRKANVPYAATTAVKDAVVTYRRDKSAREVAEDKRNEELYAADTTWKDWLKKNLTGVGFRTQFVDRWDSAMRLVEQAYTLAKDAQARASAVQAVLWARMADRTANLTAVSVSQGFPIITKETNRDGSTNWIIRKGTVSLGDMFHTLGKANPMTFGRYIMAKRAESHGYEKVYGKDTPEIRAKAAEDRKLVDTHPEFRRAEEQYIEYNKGLINLLEAASFISEKEAAELNRTKDYVPLYKKNEDDLFATFGSVSLKIGNVRYQPDLAPLIGSTHPIIPFTEAALLNTRTLIDHAVKNLAAKEFAYLFNSLGIGKLINKEIKGGKDATGRHVIHFRHHGQPYSFVIDLNSENKIAGLDTTKLTADLLATGMEGVSIQIPTIVRMLNPASRVLRYAVTRNPAYAARQLMRDPMAAWMVTGADFNPVLDTVKRVSKMLGGKDSTANFLQETGIVGGLVYEGDNETIKRQLKQLGSGDPTLWAQAMRGLDNIAIQSDAVTRANIYDSLIAQGKTSAEAMIGTMDSMNFNTHGTSKSLYLLNMTVPFLRAQVNAIDAIYKSFTGRMSMADKLKTRNELITRGMMLAAATTLYALAAQDEDWYKEATPEERYNNFFLPLPGLDQPFRVPIPFELGLIFKAVPEAMVDMKFGEEEFGDSLKGLKTLLGNSVPNPTPQMIKPLYEMFANHSMFTDRAIESAAMQDRLPTGRFTNNTTELAKALSFEFEALGETYGLSPVKIEHLVRGYFGTMGVVLTAAVDAALGLGADGVEKPAKRPSDIPAAGSLFQRIDGQNIIDKAYRAAQRIEQESRTLKDLDKAGDLEGIKRFLDSPEKTYLAGASTDAAKFKQDMAKLADEERQIRGLKNISAEDKRVMLDNLQQVRKAHAQAMFALSKTLREASEGARR